MASHKTNKARLGEKRQFSVACDSSFSDQRLLLKAKPETEGQKVKSFSANVAYGVMDGLFLPYHQEATKVVGQRHA